MHQYDNQPLPKRRSQRLIEAKASKGEAFQSLESITDPTIMSFPTEVLLLVISFLDIPSRLSLGLTCKSLAELTLDESKSDLTWQDQVEFLSTLQRDIPYTYFSYNYAKLYPLDPNLDWRSQPHAKASCFFNNSLWLPVIKRSDHMKLPRRFHLILDRTQISFMEVNLVMSRHFYGFSHGISLQTLERYEAFEDVLDLDQCLWLRNFKLSRPFKFVAKRKPRIGIRLSKRSLEAVPRAKNAWRVSFRYTAKIVDDKLYLARFYTIVGPHVSVEHFNRLINSIGIPICNHLYCSANTSCCSRYDGVQMNYLRYYPRIKTTLPSSYFGDGPEFKLDPKQDSCVVCSTDYDVSVSRKTDNHETSLSISVYHCLGSCRSPNDKLWAYFVTSGRESWNFATFLPLTKEEASDSPPPLSLGADAAAVFRNNISCRVQKLKSRTPELDRGGPRRKWHEAACLE